MTGVAAYVTLVIVVPALLLGHHGQPWPLRGACAWLRGRLSASGGLEVDREGRAAPDASSARTDDSAPSWAHTDTKEAA